MEYLHSMLRVNNLDASLDFFCNKLGMVEVSRKDHKGGRFTLVFLAATHDAENAAESKSPLLELTYNWPSEDEEQDPYSSGRNFGHLAYRVDDIYEVCQKLMDGGITINRPPRDGHMAFVKSPDGISIELLQKGEALTPASPWKDMENTGSW